MSKVSIYLLCPTKWPSVPGTEAQWAIFFTTKRFSFWRLW